jgi:hypothetical protein
MSIQPIPENLKIAKELRIEAGKMLLLAKRLEDSCPMPGKREKVTLLYSRKSKPNVGRNEEK